MRSNIYWLIRGRSRIVGQSFVLDDVSFVCDRPLVGFASTVRSVNRGICVERMRMMGRQFIVIFCTNRLTFVMIHRIVGFVF